MGICVFVIVYEYMGLSEQVISFLLFILAVEMYMKDLLKQLWHYSLSLMTNLYNYIWIKFGFIIYW